MRQPQHKNRMRARNRRQPNPVNRIYESNGPDVKIRGTAQHVAEKYMQLGRDALSSGDEIKAESYFQHAEHYYRIIAAAQEQIQQRRQQQQEQREQRMRGNGRSRSTPQPVAAVPAPEAAPALPAPDNDSSGDGVSRASEPVEETPLQPEAADAAQTVTVIDVSGEKTAAAGNGQDIAGDGMATLEPDMQVVAFTDIGTNDETEDTATGGYGKTGEDAALEAAEDWGGSPPGFLMQPVTAAETATEDKSEANGGNGAALTEGMPADANDGNIETSDATTESADADAAIADTENKPRRTRRTRTTRTTRRTRRTTRKSAASGDASADSGGASAGEA